MAATINIGSWSCTHLKITLREKKLFSSTSLPCHRLSEVQ
ncbi:hypothetical protein CASFOL_040370 [Castilleja foliolosa]|uniref:Uncharacterized protein n=1 Tax=Castilleja foliolosa TaxID=1961234 RepID=A0ABD3BG95_9LAMI